MCCICSKGIINYINPVGAHLLQRNDAYEFIGQELAVFVNLSFGELKALKRFKTLCSLKQQEVRNSLEK
jgi:hypothetical protein